MRILKFLPSKYLRDAAIGDLQDAGDVAWSSARMCQLHDLLPSAVRQRPPVDVDSTQLVDPAVACSRASKYRTSAYVVVVLCRGRTTRREKTENKTQCYKI